MLADGYGLFSTLAHTLEPRSPTTLLLLRLLCRCRLLPCGSAHVYRHLCCCRSIFRLHRRGLCCAVRLTFGRVAHSSFKSLKVFKSELFSLNLCEGSHVTQMHHEQPSCSQHNTGQSVSEPSNRERGAGQRCPLAPLLFALAIEPLSHMLKQTMSGMHIDRIHVQQDKHTHRCGNVCRRHHHHCWWTWRHCTCKGSHPVLHGGIISIHQLAQDHVVSVWQHGTRPTTRCHSWHDSGTKRQDTIPGCYHPAQPQCDTMGECTRQSIDATEGMEQGKPVHPQSRTHCAYHDSAHCGLCALSSTSTITCTVCVGA